MIQEFIKLPGADHLLIGLAFVFCVGTKQLGMWPYSLAAFPGTVAHELAHYVVAKVLLARPQLPSFIPRREGKYWVLGSVSFEPSIFTNIPIALAPFILLPAGVWYASTAMTGDMGLWEWINGWIVASMFLASVPSRQDLAVAAPALAVVALIGAGYWLALQ